MTTTFPNYTKRVYLNRVILNRGGYTSDGIYFGTGDRLYFVQDYDGDCLPYGYYFRAIDREDALEVGRHIFPNAKIKK
jgi:hypothetical protein